MPRRPPTHTQRMRARERTLFDRSRPRDTRPSAAARGYDASWRKFRKAFLQEHPLCAECLEGDAFTPGRPVPATVVDHVTPHRGDMAAFWRGPFQALCERHHNAKSARERIR